MSQPFPGHDRSRHMGELKRGDQRWDVFLELQPDPDLEAVRGRIHFVATGGARRSTGWVFLERHEKEILDRFGEFSAVELLQFVEAIPD